MRNVAKKDSISKNIEIEMNPIDFLLHSGKGRGFDSPVLEFLVCITLCQLKRHWAKITR